jgi:hypothetical protein
MATFFVDSTGVVTTASTGSDSIFIQSAAVKGSELLGLAGNDTIDLTQGAATDTSAVGMVVRASDGNDIINGSSLGVFSAGGHTLIAGSGNDTINLSGSNGDWIKGNEGADRVVLSGTGAFSAIALGGGADELILNSAITVDRIALGDGHDKISASTVVFATAGSIVGGAGRDTIDLTISDGVDSAYINGGALQDSITLQGIEVGTTVKGMGGADTITLSGDGATSAFIAGGEGADLITLSGVENASTVAGGSGNDTIFIKENMSTLSAEIFGGSGNDSIRFEGIVEDSTYAKISIEGGLGSDSIVFDAVGAASGETLGTLTYSSFGESNLAALDQFQLDGTFVTSGNGGGITLDIDYTDALTSVAVSEQSAAVLLSNATFSGNIGSDSVTLSGTFNVSSVTAVAGTVDTLTLASGKGAAVIFSTDGGNEFFFVQGGVAGTADDSIIDLGNLSGASLSLGSAATVTFSGQV